jgi:outer membrane protein assembly factor BamB
MVKAFSSLATRCALVASVIFALLVSTTTAGDWPMWRYDAGRSANSPDALPDKVSPLWKRQFPPRKTVWDDPLNQDLMPYDEVFEPVVAGKRMFLGFNDADKVVALDTSNGLILWTFYTDGPVRFPPVAHKDYVYFTSDDGYLYCVRQDDGELIWRQRGGPSERLILGNERLISTWPARGGPVVADDTVYFAASIWPFMGTFIYALDAETGDVKWLNDSSASTYIDQPHNSPAFAGVAPQGALAVSGQVLLVPGGRSVPAAFDRLTGKQLYFHLAKYNKAGGANAFAAGDYFFGHERARAYSAFDLITGEKAFDDNLGQPVVSGKRVYTSGESVAAYGYENLKPAKSKPNKSMIEKAKGALSSVTGDDDDDHEDDEKPAEKPEENKDDEKTSRAKREPDWKSKLDATGDLIKAGNRLYAGGKSGITVLEESDNGTAVRVVDTIKIAGTVKRLIAADDKLFAVTSEGGVFAFGRGLPAEPVGDAATATSDSASLSTAKAEAKNILDRTRITDGYAIVFGVGTGDLLQGLIDGSKLRLVAFDPDPAVVHKARQRFDAAGLYGNRIAIHVGTPRDLYLPPYMASLIVVADPHAAQQTASADFLKPIFDTLRPYGGKAWLPMTEDEQAAFLLEMPADAKFPQASWKQSAGAIVLERVGALPGSSTWTHIYGSMANTIKSDDSLVKLPLGILWFGGSSNMDVLPRHGHGPPEQVIGGRLFIQGMSSLSARDVYTGRVTWKAELPRLGNFGVYFDETYKDTPLSTAYNQVHIPGANSRGTNFVATEDRVYILQGPECQVLDTATGKGLGVFTLGGKRAGGKSDPKTDWAYLGIYEKLLIAGDGFASYGETPKTKDKKSAWRFQDYERVASRAIVVVDRLSGREQWRIPAKHGFLHNAITAADGTLYMLDKAPPYVEQKLKRQGKPPLAGARLVALDLNTGKLKWEKTTDVFGSWLSYSPEHKIVLQATRPSRDMTLGEDGKRMIVYDAVSGKVLWDKEVLYTDPPILHGDRILAGGRGYQLLTGETVMRDDPLTGKSIPWSYARSYGCNYPVAAENLLTFRSAAAGFYDLVNEGGVGNFGGFKSSCSSNLIAADGILNAPDYTRTCTCSYQNQTSLGFIHMPELEMWTRNDYTYRGGSIDRIGVNLGAPGDRRDSTGTLWLEHPSRGAPSPKVPIDVTGTVKYFHQNAGRFEEELPWVSSSGVEGDADIRITLNRKGDPLLEEGLAIATGADDAEEDAKGEVDLDSSDIELIKDETDQVIGLRFTEVEIPAGAEIDAAYIQFTSKEKRGEPAELMIAGEDTDNSSPFTKSDHNISRRARTKAQVAWKPGPWEKDAKEKTVDVASIVQAVVGRAGWKSGNALTFVVAGRGKRVAHSVEGSSSGAPRLVVRLSVKSQLAAPSATPRYTVRLHFAEPEALSAGARVFDVYVQGEKVLDGFDIVVAAGGPQRGVVREIPGIEVNDALSIQLKSVTSRPPILSGVEAVRESTTEASAVR